MSLALAQSLVGSGDKGAGSRGDHGKERRHVTTFAGDGAAGRFPVGHRQHGVAVAVVTGDAGAAGSKVNILDVVHMSCGIGRMADLAGGSGGTARKGLKVGRAIGDCGTVEMNRVSIGGKGCIIGLVATAAGDGGLTVPDRGYGSSGVTVGRTAGGYAGTGACHAAEGDVYNLVRMKAETGNRVDGGAVGDGAGMTELATEVVGGGKVKAMAVTDHG